MRGLTAAIIATLLILHLGGGCAAKQSGMGPVGVVPTRLEPPDIFTTYLRNVPENMEERVDHFGPGDYPAVIIVGYSGQIVILHIIERVTGTTIDSDSRYITNTWHHVDFSRLGSGDYVVRLFMRGEVQDAYPFTVAR